MTLLQLYGNDPKRWTQGNTARDKDGKRVGPLSPKAESWCMTKAIIKCYPLEERDRVYSKLYKAICQVLGVKKLKGKIGWVSWRSGNGYNDRPERQFSEIMKIVRLAGV